MEEPTQASELEARIALRDETIKLMDGANQANLAKLKLLAQDADDKKAAMLLNGENTSSHFYAGMRDGLLRAITVLEGRG